MFIIDQYSLDGGKIAIPQKKRAYKPLFETNPNEMLLIDIEEFSDYGNVKSELKSKFEQLFSDGQNEQNKIDGLSRDKEDEKMSNYLDHCARAYCVLKYLNNNDIKAMPRTIDDLFLRLKKGK